MRKPSILMALSALTACMTFMLSLAPRTVAAQGMTLLHACYVPSSGTVYRIKEPGLRQECGTSIRDGKTEKHVEFDWLGGLDAAKVPLGGTKTIDHGALSGLGDDDHVQYVPASGVRGPTTGFALTGTLGTPSPMPSFSYAGATRLPALLWHAGKGAFRAGALYDGTVPLAWNEQSIGEYSVAMGLNPGATGSHSVAIGWNAYATGEAGLAFGTQSRALGINSIGIGGSAQSDAAIAIGGTADGAGSVTLGRRGHANGQDGAVVIAAGAPQSGTVQAQTPGQLVASASSFWLGSGANVTATPFRLIETSTGAYLSTGGAWVTVSDSAKKTAFADIDAEDVLGRIAGLRIRTWSYLDEQPGVRHLGPTAQAFHAAFGLGDTDKAIASVDADGVSLAAIQALEGRTRTQASALAALTERSAQLEARLDAVLRELESLRQELRRGAEPSPQR